jgi:hypothetical protein
MYLADLTKAVREVLFGRGVWLHVMEKEIRFGISQLGIKSAQGRLTFQDRLAYLWHYYPRLCEELGLFAFSEDYQRELDFIPARRASWVESATKRELWKLALITAIEEEFTKNRNGSQLSVEIEVVKDWLKLVE